MYKQGREYTESSPRVSGTIVSDALVRKTPILVYESALPRDMAIVNGCLMSAVLFLGFEIR
jgi:hypothetical protein